MLRCPTGSVKAGGDALMTKTASRDDARMALCGDDRS